MSMKVNISDPGLDIHVCVRASGGFSPDAMNDLKNRALDVYRAALAAKVKLGEIVDEPAEAEAEQTSE